MSSVTWMSVCLCVAAFVAVLCEPANPQPTRCLSLCLRSETEDSCQRCRLRVPMRFGKRYEIRDSGGESFFEPQLKPASGMAVPDPSLEQSRPATETMVDQPNPSSWLLRLWPESPKRWQVIAIQK